MSKLLSMLTNNDDVQNRQILNAVIVGNPSITDDFIVNNFSSSDYLKFKFNSLYKNLGTSFKIRVKFKVDDLTITDQPIINCSPNNTGIRFSYNGDGAGQGCFSVLFSKGTQWAYTSTYKTSQIYTEAGVWVWAEIGYIPSLNKYYLDFSYDGINYTNMWSTSINAAPNFDNLTYAIIGNGGSVSIDLKELYVLHSDEITYHAVLDSDTSQINAVVRGNPNITEDLVANYFSASNYIEFNGGRLNESEYNIKFRPQWASTTGDRCLISTENWLNVVVRRVNGVRNFYSYNWETASYVALNGSFSNSNDYWLRVVCSGNQKTFYMSTDGQTYTEIGTYSDSVAPTQINDNYPFRFGMHSATVADSAAFEGFIYFKECNIKQNGEIVWQGEGEPGIVYQNMIWATNNTYIIPDISANVEYKVSLKGKVLVATYTNTASIGKIIFGNTYLSSNTIVGTVANLWYSSASGVNVTLASAWGASPGSSPYNNNIKVGTAGGTINAPDFSLAIDYTYPKTGYFGIFAYWSGTSADYYSNDYVGIEQLQFKDQNDEILHDLKPAKFNSRYGLFDTVTNRFYIDYTLTGNLNCA